MNEKDKAIYIMDILLRDSQKTLKSHEDLKEALAEKGVHKNIESIKKYLHEMKGNGAPIDKTRGGYGYSDPEYTYPLVELDPSDYLQFQFTIAGLEVYKNTPLYKHSQQVLKKFTTTGDEEIDQWLNQNVSILPDSWVSIKEEVWNGLLESLNNSSYIRLTYHRDSSSEEKKVIIEPYHIYFAKGNWYLIGRNKSRSWFTTYALSRMTEIELLPETFKREEFSFKEYIDRDNYGFFGAGGDPFLVKVLVDITRGNWIYERQWTANQRVEAYDENNILLQFYANNDWEVKSLLLSWGSSATLLEPQSMVDQIREDLTLSLQKYQQKS